MPRQAGVNRIHVAAGILRDASGRVLLTRRPAGKHLEGLWEFPGGKLEPGEAPRAGLARELAEELGVRVRDRDLVPLISIPHDYPEKRVRLDVFEVERFDGEPRAREGQEMRWLTPDDMPVAHMPAADRPVVTALRLPPVYAISPDPWAERPDPGAARDGAPGARSHGTPWTERDGPQTAERHDGAPGAYVARADAPGADGILSEARLRQWLAELDATLESGVRLLQLRAKTLPEPALRALAAEAAARCRRAGARLLLNGPLRLVRELDLDGVHVDSRTLMTLAERPLSRRRWVGASCHDEAELRQAQAIGVDFACLSPVKATVSHPGVAGMGFGRFAALVEGVAMPVYALGGCDIADLSSARNSGGQGVAGISAVWRAG